MKYFVLLFIAINSTSCGSQGAQEDTENLSDPLVEELIETDTLTKEATLNNEPTDDLETLAKNGVLIDFDDVKVLIDTLDIWEDGPVINGAGKDTVWVSLGLGYGVDDRSFQFFCDRLTELRIYQSYETSMQVMREGPHCDLINWKHYNSEWTELNIIDNAVQTNGYSEEEWTRFVDVDMADAHEEVRRECGDEWAEYASVATSPNEYPCGVSINLIYFRIEYIRLGEDNVITKYLAFYIPMGC